MVKKLVSKKGIFFTAMLVLMSTTLLTLSLLLFHNSLESEKRFVELASLDTMYNLYTSIEKSILDIFLYVTGEDYTNTLWTNEYYLDDSLQMMIYQWDLNETEIQQIEPVLLNFKQFVEETHNFISLNITPNLPGDPNSASITINISVNLPGMNVKKQRLIIYN